MPFRDILVALLIISIWGSAFVVTKLALLEMPPILLTALRFLFAALPLVFFVARPKIPLRLLLGYGFLIGVMQFGLLNGAIAIGMPAGLSSVIMQLQGFFTAGLAFTIFGERPTQWQIIGALIAFSGVGIMAFGSIEGATPLAFAMVVVASCSWAGGNIIAKWAGQIDMFPFVIWSFLVAPVPLLVASVVIEGPGPLKAFFLSPSWREIWTVGYSAYPATVLTFGLWTRLLSRYPAAQVTPFSLLLPVTGLICAYLVFGEPLTDRTMLGSAMVVAGLMLSVFGGSIFRTRIA